MKETLPKQILGLKEYNKSQEKIENTPSLDEIEEGLKLATDTGRLLEQAYWEEEKEKYLKGGRDSGPEYWELRDYLEHHQKEIAEPIIQEARIKRNELLDGRGVFQMSEEDFNTYFLPAGIFNNRESILKQDNVGDCYAVAAIHAFSRSPHFEMICRSSMRRLADGSWEVRLPFLSQDGEVITITPDELVPQKNAQFLKRKEGKIMPDTRRRLRPPRAKEGLRVLEAAFIKQKFGTVDRLSAEGGWGDDVLLSLGGDNFTKYSLDSFRYNSGKEKYEYFGLNTLSAKNMARLDHYLNNFDPEIHIATASTRTGAVSEMFGFYKGRGG